VPTIGLQTHTASFAKVLDGRKQPIRGLWQRDSYFYVGWRKSFALRQFLLSVEAANSSNSNIRTKTQLMKNAEKRNLLKWNTILWLAAMALPAFFSIAFASTKFPWPMILPLLLLGPMLFSNKMLTQAMGQSVAAPTTK
jgi:hypothetical protein